LGHADHLAIAGPGAQRRRIEVMGDDLMSRSAGIRAITIGTGRGRQHLAEFFANSGGAPTRRMPELFDLGGKRAGPALTEAAVDYAGHLPRRGPHESAPVNGWLPSRVLMVEQPVILDEQHAGDDQWRARPEIPVGQ